MVDRIHHIEQLLRNALTPEKLEVEDQSHLHVGHEGAKGGAGHYAITIVSENFIGLDSLGRHRLIYDALKELMQKDIHALSIKASAPKESAGKSGGGSGS